VIAFADMVTDQFGTWFVQTGIAVSVLTLFVLAIRRPFAQYFGARAAYALWILPVLRLIWPSFTIPDYFGLFAPAAPETDSLTPKMEPVFFEQIPALTTSGPGLNWALLLFFIWLAGSLVWTGIQARYHLRFVRDLRAGSVPAPAQLALPLYRVQKELGLKSRPVVRISDGEEGPLVTGIIRPMVILPMDFFTRFTPNQQYFVLMHECAHIRRRDIWASVLCLLFRAINWPNPLIHYAATKFRSDQEAACDATVLRIINQSVLEQRDSTHGYAQTLLTAIRNPNGQNAPVPLGLTMTHPLKERLMTIKQSHRKTGPLMRVSAMALILGIAAVTAPVSFSHPPDSEDRLAGEHKTDRTKSVIKVETDDDGKTVKKHYEITRDNGKVEAFEIDENGKKTAIELKDIEGFDPEMMKGHSFSFAWGDDHKFKFLQDGHSFPNVMKFKDLENAFVFEMPDVPVPPDAPFPPGFDFEWFGDHDLLADAEGRKAHIKGLVLKSRLKGVESQLKAAERLIESAEKDTKNNKKQQKAQRELEKARKALQAAQRALSEDE